MTVKKRILIASGGTGGHFYPAFALAVELRARGWQALFLVKKEDLARPALEDADFPYAELDMVSLPRGLNPLAHAAFLIKFFRSMALALRIIKDFGPDAVLGTGSYISFPAVIAARLGGVPSAIHESNASFGLSNRIAARFADKIALGLPVKNNPFAYKSELTGTPIRAFFAKAPGAKESRERLGLDPDAMTFLVFGGSQGAGRLNSAASAAAARLRDKGLKFQLLHITGRRDFEAVRSAYEKAGLYGLPGIKVMDYCERIDELYPASDLVISRSGASTIAELAYLSKPSILVPFPASASGHQKENALALAACGGAVLLEESPGFEDALEEAMRKFIARPASLLEMARSISGAQVPDAVKASSNLLGLIEGLAGGAKP
ncbi:MAG: undecaprenyldiphospho-muramoylpentapeptide beta-N-acetylglucosaminyltransferase [Elusimicrobiota bacterium]|nr:undecaprenyldiphospho-muramoylpentapeptide beta-N-acetylglucosaminyltransferase [Elusimicrobiota bacterium]